MENQARGKNKKKWIVLIVALAAAVAAAFFLFRFLKGGGAGKSGEKAYVDTVANWTGQGSGLGAIDRFAGVVESQETWSVNQNPDVQVKEIFVTVGQEIKKDDPLFVYDVEEYQSKLDQAAIDKERMENEQKTMKETLDQLNKDKGKAAASEQADYTVRIQEQEIALKQKELEIKSKQTEIDKINKNMENATVVSEIDGVVKSINKGGVSSDIYSGENDGSFITVMKTGDLRIKGTVNEQNIQFLSANSPVIVKSRAGDESWRGVISKIDTENAVQQGANYYGNGNSETSSSKYPFYVDLHDSTGLMMGQHVYIEPDFGQDKSESRDGIWLDAFFVDMTDPSAPFVWADNGKGRLEKHRVTVGVYDEELMQYHVTGGLALTDKIAQISGELREGMATADMEEYWATMDPDSEEGGMPEEMTEEMPGAGADTENEDAEDE